MSWTSRDDSSERGLASAVAHLVSEVGGEVDAALKTGYVATADVDQNVTAADVPFLPAGSITATDVQSAIEQVSGSASAAVGAKVYMSSNQTLAASAPDTQIKFASTAWSYGGVVLNTSAQNGITVSTKGLYLFTGAANLFASAAGYRAVSVYVNYTKITEFGRDGDASEQDAWPAQIPLSLAANDFVSLNAYTNGNASTIAGNAGGTLTWASLVLLGTTP